jgi:excisionase family DNA binding protein
MRPLISYEKLAAYLGLSRRTIERMVEAGTFPKPVPLSGNRVAFYVDEVVT